MQELEKILAEIDIKIAGSMGKKREGLLEAREIIRKHMDDGWIPVEERLPEDEEMVLVTCQTKTGRKSVNRAWYGEGFWHGTGSMSGVIAWRSLPEPYRPAQAMIDNHRVRQMAREYEMNPSVARRLLENARDVPALRRGMWYREMTGGDAGEPKEETAGYDVG